jgi:2-oxoglutarate ferredoxin oxidoreductase subunit alpha
VLDRRPSVRHGRGGVSAGPHGHPSKIEKRVSANADPGGKRKKKELVAAMDYTIKIGGAAGQGIQTIGFTLSKVFSRYGYDLFSYQDYESRVRGGHNFYQIRFADSKVLCPREPVDILVALDAASIPLHSGELSDVGFAIYDSEDIKETHKGRRYIDIPMSRMALERGGSKIMANTAACGAVMGMMGMKVELLEDVLASTLKRKETLESNIKVARAGYEFGNTNCPECSFQPAGQASAKMTIEGNEAIAFGAIASGCKFYSAYPMTPSTGILTFMAGHAERHGIVVEQAEDEVAAINMALGASFAGVRAMTGTSGGGFALMVEGISLAGMTETPVVMVLAQRPGPATGFPTRTEQSDLLFGLFAGHGEFPRAVFAPGSPEQAFKLVNKAFDITEKYQVPVIILTDQHLADSAWSLDGIDLDHFKYTDYRLRGEEFAGLTEYKRHAFTDSGVSPLAVPGEGPHVVVTDSDEHDEEGHIVEDAETRTLMVDKRYFKKLPRVKIEIEPPLLYGAEEPEVVLVGWGSNYGVMREAVDSLGGGSSIAMMHFSELYPFPEAGRAKFMGTLEKARMAICIENNASGRFASLMRMETGFKFERAIHKYDGRPFTLEGLLEEINGHLSGVKRTEAGMVPGVR